MVSFIADLIGILGFLGLNGDRSLRIAVGATIAITGIAIAGIFLLRSVRFWSSAEGAYHPRRYYQRRIGGAAISLLAAAVLGIAVVNLAASENPKPKQTNVIHPIA